MRDLNAIALQCINELENIGIRCGRIGGFSVNTRAKRRWGQCRRTNGVYYIDISVELIKDDTDIFGLKNTIMHELLHTLPNCMNHGERWNYYASMVNRKLGYNVKRTNSDEECGLSADNIARRREENISRMKYKAVCSGCGVVNYYQRWSKFLENPQYYKCTKCGTIFDKHSISGVNGNVIMRASWC